MCGGVGGWVGGCECTRIQMVNRTAGFTALFVGCVLIMCNRVMYVLQGWFY